MYGLLVLFLRIYQVPKWNISAPSIERRRVRVVSAPGGGYSSPIFSLHRRPFKSALFFYILCINQAMGNI
jgi:hypothetical protein